MAEGFAGDMVKQMDAGEGCNVYGHVEVPKVAGNLHFAPSSGVQQAYTHTKDLVHFAHGAFNISHRINGLSFGEYFPGQHYLLDGAERILAEENVSGMHQYFSKLVPTVFVEYEKPEVHSYQFSVTEHLRRLDTRALSSENMAGVLVSGTWWEGRGAQWVSRRTAYAPLLPRLSPRFPPHPPSLASSSTLSCRPCACASWSAATPSCTSSRASAPSWAASSPSWARWTSSSRAG